MKYDYLIVGAGYAGCVLAERLASQLDKKVLLIDRRSHIGGNAYDSLNDDGIRIHHYGPHLFHTNSDKVVSYLSQFTEWHPYQHRVRSFVNGILVPMPINRNTVNQLLGYTFRTDDEVKQFFEAEREAIKEIKNSEDFVVSRVGRRLYSSSTEAIRGNIGDEIHHFSRRRYAEDSLYGQIWMTSISMTDFKRCRSTVTLQCF